MISAGPLTRRASRPGVARHLAPAMATLAAAMATLAAVMATLAAAAPREHETASAAAARSSPPAPSVLVAAVQSLAQRLDGPEAPAVESSTPAVEAIGVPGRQPLVVRFSKRMAVATLDDRSITLIGPAGVEPVTVDPDEHGMLAIVRPRKELMPASRYTLFVDGATDRARRPLPLSVIGFDTAAKAARAPAAIALPAAVASSHARRSPAIAATPTTPGDPTGRRDVQVATADIDLTREPLAALGRMLFADPALSADGRVACATCHKPEQAFADGQPRASGAFGRAGTRNTPSLLDVGRQRRLFWDGRRTGLDEQALDPLLNRVEHGLRDEAQLLDRVRSEPRYAAMVRRAYGIPVNELTSAHVGRALSAFERTLVSAASPFDRFLAGDRAALSPAARRGWQLFDQRAHCTRCHVVEPAGGQPPLLTDHRFHSLAVGFAGVARKLPQLTARLIAAHRTGQTSAPDVLIDTDLAQLGRFAVTLAPRDLAAFKTPSLRNVALTAPYMHDGSVPTLAEAVDIEVYDRNRADRPLVVNPAERSDLVAFLQALTSDRTTPRQPDQPQRSHRQR